MIKHIYSDRCFCVVDGKARSERKRQLSGISQGCPLSPFLFTMLMTVVMRDAVHMLPPASQDRFANGALDVILYADDTLLLGLSEGPLQEFLNAVSEVGGRFGMELHWSKFQLLQVNVACKLHAPSGEDIPRSELLSYLGASIYDDGGIKSELNKKLGAAWGDFNKLVRVWRHSALARDGKIRIFQAMIVTRILYGLSSAWLNVAEMRRLNGFYCRCLRIILGIKPAYISRVSNALVIQRSGQVTLGRQLLRQQLLLYGRIARAPAQDVLRKLTFTPGSLQPATSRYVRCRGRPRNEWTTMLQKEIPKVSPIADEIVHNVVEWRRAVYRYCMK